ncbi:linear amide C-N hydrolase [Flavobacterium agricola]|uniref:Linear amide C-N hydrolase n=1 Tax=Flavobacterium agricola TaxID=2870839 RepID=A0ABY6LW87_9FLAO|nr:linear amide C-N hydrolase [Flavobacterium agricola]UYW00592.1 linear amide C-N hydrolase [Flavobacterium agricola]
MAQNVTFKNFDEFKQPLQKFNAPFACTSLIVKDLNNNVYHGRGMELTFGEALTSLTYYPKGYSFQHLAPNKTPGLQYTAKYAILALTTPVSVFDVKDALEGFNDAGLAFSLNMMPSPPLNEIKPEEYKNAVPYASFGEWVLANFATVDEVKAGLTQGVVFWSEALEMLGGLETPFHFAVYDKAGGSIVVEVKNGALVVYDNPTGVMTNGPEFPWHMENLNNYSHITNIDTTIGKVGDLNLRQPDSGIATSVLPSSATSVGRFIKAFYFSTYANRVADPDLQLVELGHVMNNFDRPKNITKDLSGEGEQATPAKYMTEFTLWTVLTDLTRGQMYVRLYDSLNYQKFTFADYKDKTEMVSFLIK